MRDHDNLAYAARRYDKSRFGRREMSCSRCGDPNTDGAWFCVKCGSPIQSAAVAAAAPAAAAPKAATRWAPPQTAEPQAAHEADDEAWQAVIGKNPDYYLARFAAARASGGGVGMSWHWPAFFVTWYWLLYRKMWGWAIFYLIFPGIVALLAGAVIGATNSAVAGGLLYGFALFLAPPLFANALYYRRCRGLVQSQGEAVSRERYLARLEARGGTSNIVVIILGFISVIALVGIMAAVALPAYQDYTRRAKVAEALSAANTTARLVGDHYERTGALPHDLDTLPDRPALPRVVQSLELNPRNGTLEMVLAFGPGSEPASVLLVPTADAQRRLSWSCKAAPNLRRVMPKSCRGAD
jgi:hypothetical protein